MKKQVLFVMALLLSIGAVAQQPLTFKKKGYTLIVANNDPKVDLKQQVRLITTFFQTYPKLAKAYNKNTADTVYLMLDTAYTGVAATGHARVRLNANWIIAHPEDIDVITHEVMHIVQNYGRSVGPGWLTEGIADYARYQFGVNNQAAKWVLPEFKTSQNYSNGYRVTARFLAWIEKHVKKGTVKALDEQLRNHSYTAGSWEAITGKTLDELWKAYAADPAV
ncbi:basic secretory peptidase family protein [Mucilaginibacter yixingensis]|uniref:Basic secretory peptidase family protein n=1 Tax=Mucilaginibacter yixingensis TaxID=1295612 RepID=A0A2T5J7I2_9SPHI|nr:basic secretory protein-like protein [Mucilaginibacter yixingensis]PTQ95105.1 basic secretory peptidase family protein [Mucilaginibacter yixingensis]